MNTEDPLVTTAREKALKLIELTDTFVSAASAAQQAVNKRSSDMDDKLVDLLTQFELVENAINVLNVLQPLITDQQQQVSLMAGIKNANLGCRRSLSRVYRALAAVENLGVEARACLKQMEDILVEVKQEDVFIKQESAQPPPSQRNSTDGVHLYDRSSASPAAEQTSMDALMSSLDIRGLSSLVPQQANPPLSAFANVTTAGAPAPVIPEPMAVSTIHVQQPAFLPAEQQPLDPLPLASNQQSHPSTFVTTPSVPMDVCSAPTTTSSVAGPFLLQQHPRLQPHVSSPENVSRESAAASRSSPSVATSHFLDQFEATAKPFAEKAGYTIDDAWEKMLVYALPNEIHSQWAHANIFNRNLPWAVAKELYKEAFPDPVPFANVVPAPAQSPITPVVDNQQTMDAYRPAPAPEARPMEQQQEAPPVKSPTKSSSADVRRLNSSLVPTPEQGSPSKSMKIVRDTSSPVRASERMQRYAEALIKLKQYEHDTIKEHTDKFLLYCDRANMNLKDVSLFNRFVKSLTLPYRKAIQRLMPQLGAPPANKSRYLFLARELEKLHYSHIATEKLIVGRNRKVPSRPDVKREVQRRKLPAPKDPQREPPKKKTTF